MRLRLGPALDVKAQPAPRRPGVAALKLIDRQPTQLVGQAFGETKMQRANRIGIEHRRVDEGAGSQDEVDPVALSTQLRIEPPSGNGVMKLGDDIAPGLRFPNLELASGAATHVDGAVTGTNHLGQEQAQSLIGAFHAPSAVAGGIHLE
jgi:hypothetical protein